MKVILDYTPDVSRVIKERDDYTKSMMKRGFGVEARKRIDEYNRRIYEIQK